MNKRKGICENCHRYAVLHRHHPDYNQLKHTIDLCPQCHSAVHQISASSGQKDRPALSEKIKALRLDKLLTQEQLAYKCGLSSRTVHRAETGISMSRLTLSRLAKGLEVDSLELINVP